MRLSIVTAAWAPTSQFLPLLAHSVAQFQREVGSHHQLEWIVVEDGDDPCLEPVVRSAGLAAGTSTYLAVGRHVGVAQARNRALSFVTGDVVTNLDHDDVVQPAGFGKLLGLLERHRELGWAVGRADDLLPDGTTIAFPPPWDGRVEAEVVGAWWESHQRLPVHTVGFCVRTELARAVGGWMALDADDVGLSLAASALAPGWVSQQCCVHYRKHPHQQSANEVWSARSWEECSPVIRQRLRALRSMTWNAPVEYPEPAAPTALAATR